MLMNILIHMDIFCPLIVEKQITVTRSNLNTKLTKPIFYRVDTVIHTEDNMKDSKWNEFGVNKWKPSLPVHCYHLIYPMKSKNQAQQNPASKFW